MERGAEKTILNYFSRKQKVIEEIIESESSFITLEATSVASLSTNIDESEFASSFFCNSENQINRRDPFCGKNAALEYFKDGPFQPSPIQFPETKGRRFRSAWYSQFKWLEYSLSSDKAFCFPCRLFGSIGCYDETFITNGFKNWKKATQRFQEHERTPSHLSALQRWQDGLKSKESITEKISSHHKEEVKKNREYLKILFETLLFLGSQGLALRGHREEESSDNRGNFIELLKLRSLDNSLLKRMFLEREKYFNYAHHDVQNEMVEILARQIKTQICENVKKNNYFSVIVDETPDVANHEQVTIVLRYVTDDLEIEERFIGFFKTDLTDGESLYRLLLSVLNEVGLETSNIVAQCYDGAANMSGIYKGVAARLKENNPNAMYVHCYMHSLNLALVDLSKSISMVRNVFSTVHQLYCFVEASPKRHAIFINIKERSLRESNETESRTQLSLKTLSDTRFSSRYESLRAVQQHLPEITQTLEEIEANDARVGGEAHGLLLFIKKI